ncbi:transporter substrate-binding domain-containing protein [Psychromonas sp. MME2]|uniref:substrate-binding periplasmic protein n=1 Tax=unclassified Psychromonas TaxID=2614957 RepID=UPI00339BC4FD
MKNTKLTIYFLLLLFIHLPSSSTADEITIVADQWYPYNGDEKSPGYGIEIAKHIFQAAGHKIIYKIMPWNRAIKKTREGKFNAIIGAMKEEAPDFIFPEEEFGISEEMFFAKKGSTWRYNGIKSLQGINIGLIKDYSYGNELEDFFADNPDKTQYAQVTKPLEMNIKKLLYGRVDVIIEDPVVLAQTSMQMGLSEQLIKVGKTTQADKVYVSFSPNIAKSKEYAEIYTEGIRKLQASGELEKILAKYHLTYWK